MTALQISSLRTYAFQMIGNQLQSFLLSRSSQTSPIFKLLYVYSAITATFISTVTISSFSSNVGDFELQRLLKTF